MNRFRGLRAMLVITLTWAVFWGVIGPLITAAVLLVIGASGPFSGSLGHVWGFIMGFAVIGAAMGLGFSGLIALSGRRDGWSLTRGWALLLGAVGGVVVYGLYLTVIALADVGGGPILDVLPATIIAGLGAVTGVLTFGAAARGSLPGPIPAPKHLEE